LPLAAFEANEIFPARLKSKFQSIKIATKSIGKNLDARSSFALVKASNKAGVMNTSSIGVQTISPTTGTAAQNPNPPRDDGPAPRVSSERVNPSPPPGTGNIVDKTA
jgi:hypothetical protein